MRLELIAPASEDSTFLPRMGLGILIARTPRDVEVSYTDEVLLVLDVPLADVERLAAALRDATRGHARFDAIAP